VNGNGVKAQAPFDPNAACPTTALYGQDGLLLDAETIADQVDAVASCY
jgi:hypothetical protein